MNHIVPKFSAEWNDHRHCFLSDATLYFLQKKRFLYVKTSYWVKYLEALYIPGSVEECVGVPTKECAGCTVYTPASSPVRELCEEWGISWADIESDRQ